MFRKPNSQPEDFNGLQPFERAWRDLEALQPGADKRLTQELAALLVADMRASGPDWPTERFRLLADLLRELRS